MGRRVRRTAFVPRIVFGTACAVTVVPVVAQGCSSPGSANYGKGGRGGTSGSLSVAAGFGGVAAGFGGLGVAAGFGGMGVAAGFGGTSDSGEDAADANGDADAGADSEAGPRDSSGGSAALERQKVPFGELALAASRTPARVRGRRRRRR